VQIAKVYYPAETSPRQAKRNTVRKGSDTRLSFK